MVWVLEDDCHEPNQPGNLCKLVEEVAFGKNIYFASLGFELRISYYLGRNAADTPCTFDSIFSLLFLKS
jgi:hypothetical protein